jgi:hypothetical protein
MSNGFYTPVILAPAQNSVLTKPFLVLGFDDCLISGKSTVLIQSEDLSIHLG